MNAARWQRIRALFAKSLEQPDAVRDAWLQHECGDDADTLAEIRRLLGHRSQPASIFRDDAQALLAKLAGDETVEDARLGADVGPYRLRKLLGVGGMGRVYLAERTTGDFRQQVALKLIRSEFATNELRQRFLRERNTLARLAHPNIAHLHDGGVGADGAPYFTLEYIEGEPITRWCDAHACDVRARARLMLKVCDAVLHAHRNLIVHRDLKPSNILVNAEGEPKLLDFGIAKPLADTLASETLTNADARPMTREYAAPEQLLGDPVTTATDIYALGVLLYLLLSGHMPYRRAEMGETSWIKAILEDAPEAMERAIDRSDAEPIAKSRTTMPAALKRTLRGDLERIVQRALAKNAESRYATADKLADDLRAYLAGRAISGGTRTYRMRKFVRRHWLPLSAGALLFFIVLASAIGLAWEAGQVERQARTTAAVKDFILDLFQKANPEYTNGKMPTMRDAVDLGAKRLDAIPATEPELRAELQVTLGMIYQQLGFPQQAYDMHAAALAVLKEHASDPLLTVRAERFEAVEVGNLGDFAAAKSFSDDALQRIHRLRRPPIPELVRTLDTANYVAIHRSDLAAQKSLSDEAITALQSADAAGADVDDEVRAMALAMKADYLRKSHDDAGAVAYYRRVWLLKISPQTRSAYGMMMGVSLQNLGHYDEAADYLGKTWNSTKQAYGDSNSRTLRIGQVLVINEAYAGHIRQAAEHIAALLDASARQSPPHEDVAAEIQLNYGEMLTALEDYDRAAEHIRATLAYCESHPNGQADLHVEAESALGFVQLGTDRPADAQQLFERALRIAADRGFSDTATTRARLAYAQALQDKFDEALTLARQARDDAVQGGGEKSFDTADVHYFYGRVLELAERSREAEGEYRASLASHAALLPPEGLHYFSAATRFALGRLLAGDARTREEGRRFLEQAATLREDTLGSDNPHTREARLELAKLAAAH